MKSSKSEKKNLRNQNQSKEKSLIKGKVRFIKGKEKLMNIVFLKWLKLSHSWLTKEING